MEQADFWIILGVTSQKPFKNQNYTRELYYSQRRIQIPDKNKKLECFAKILHDF